MFDSSKKTISTVFGTEVNMYHRNLTTDLMTIEAVMKYDEYDANNLKPYYKDHDTFIDIGSHVGSWALLMASLNPTFIVHAYEALPENYVMIHKNILANQFCNVIPYSFAVTDCSKGKFPIYTTSDATPFERQHRFIGSSAGAGAVKIMVDQISLNDVLAKVKHVKVLKTDAEGAECFAFPKLCKEEFNKIDFIVGEFHGLAMDYDQFWGYFKPYFDDISKPTEEKYLRDFLFKNRQVKT